MKIKFLVLVCVAAFLSACGGSVSVSTNTSSTAGNAANKAANSTANANAAPANAAAAPAADGSVVKIEDAGIQFTVPKGFKFSKDGEDTAVTTEDEGVETRFSVPESGDYDAAVKDAAKELDEYITDVKMQDQPDKGEVDGMELTSMKGTGKDADGKDVKFALQVLKTAKKPVLIITYAEQASLDKHSKDLAAFYGSVKKIQ